MLEYSLYCLFITHSIESFLEGLELTVALYIEYVVKIQLNILISIFNGHISLWPIHLQVSRGFLSKVFLIYRERLSEYIFQGSLLIIIDDEF